MHPWKFTIMVLRAIKLSALFWFVVEESIKTKIIVDKFMALLSTKCFLTFSPSCIDHHSWFKLFLCTRWVILFSLTPKRFASLEAKRKFRAPWMSPNHPSPEDNSSLSPKEYITVDAAECKTNCLPASLLESENMGTVPLANNPVSDINRSFDKVHLNITW